MTDMNEHLTANNRRCAEITTRANALRSAALTLTNRLGDARLKEFVRSDVLLATDDVLGFVLENFSKAATEHQSMWLDGAALRLSIAEQQFDRWSSMIQSRGGPETVETAG